MRKCHGLPYLFYTFQNFFRPLLLPHCSIASTTLPPTTSLTLPSPLSCYSLSPSISRSLFYSLTQTCRLRRSESGSTAAQVSQNLLGLNINNNHNNSSNLRAARCHRDTTLPPAPALLQPPSYRGLAGAWMSARACAPVHALLLKYYAHNSANLSPCALMHSHNESVCVCVCVQCGGTAAYSFSHL